MLAARGGVFVTVAPDLLFLKDTDGDGHFDASTEFATGLMIPQGTLWYRGSLYVSAAPAIWKLTDTDGDGVAEKREKWFDGGSLTGCANDLHGPYLGRDGWLYWCKGGSGTQTHAIPGNPQWTSRASHISSPRLRVRPEPAPMAVASSRCSPEAWTILWMWSSRPPGSGFSPARFLSILPEACAMA